MRFKLKYLYPHGSEMAPTSSGNLVSSAAIVSAACVGAALCTVYVIWGPDHFFRKRGEFLSTSGDNDCCTIAPLWLHHVVVQCTVCVIGRKYNVCKS